MTKTTLRRAWAPEQAAVRANTDPKATVRRTFVAAPAAAAAAPVATTRRKHGTA